MSPEYEGEMEVIAFDPFDYFKDQSKEEIKLSLKYMINLSALEKQGLSSEHIHAIIEENQRKYLAELSSKKTAGGRPT